MKHTGQQFLPINQNLSNHLQTIKIKKRTVAPTQLPTKSTKQSAYERKEFAS
jgi:hypothetical protein